MSVLFFKKDTHMKEGAVVSSTFSKRVLNITDFLSIVLRTRPAIPVNFRQLRGIFRSTV